MRVESFVGLVSCSFSPVYQQKKGGHPVCEGLLTHTECTTCVPLPTGTSVRIWGKAQWKVSQWRFQHAIY